MRQNSGFTLLEVLAVVAIVVVLAALLWPVLNKAKEHSKDAVTISNLRQNGVALLIYSEDHGGLESLPNVEATRQVLIDMPTCDPKDIWRSSCEELLPDPMVGSYAYVRGVAEYKDIDDWRDLHQEHTPSTTLFMSVFSATNEMNKVEPVQFDAAGNLLFTNYPNKTIHFLEDGSVSTRNREVDPTSRLIWWRLFEEKTT